MQRPSDNDYHLIMSKDSFYIPLEDARSFCLDVYRQLNVPEDENIQLADIILDASLRGVDTHGILISPIYAQRIRSGQIIPGSSDSGSSVLASTSSNNRLHSPE